jgi:hypothetical protein
VTTVLLSVITYLKDKRLPPDGLDKKTAEEANEVHGSAEADQNFVGSHPRERRGDRWTGPVSPSGAPWQPGSRFVTL